MNKLRKVALMTLVVISVIAMLTPTLTTQANQPHECYLASFFRVNAGRELWLFTSATAADTGRRLNAGEIQVIGHPTNGRVPIRVVNTGANFWISTVACSSGVLIPAGSNWQVTPGSQLWIFSSATAADTGRRLNAGRQIQLANGHSNGRQLVRIVGTGTPATWELVWVSAIAFNSGVLRRIN